VIHALKEAASMLNQEGRISQQVFKGMEKSPIPMVPFSLWRRMFIPFAAMGWKKRASRHGVTSLQMNARPYAQ